MLILSYLRSAKLFDDNARIMEAALVLIDRLMQVCSSITKEIMAHSIQADEQLPHFRYSEVLWKGVEAFVQPQEKAPAKILLWGYLLFQVCICSRLGVLLIYFCRN